MLIYDYTPKAPYDTQLPKLRICAKNGYLTAVSWLDNNSSSMQNEQPYDLKDVDESLVMRTIKALDDYFAGQLTVFNLPLKFEMGTEFQQKVWHKLSKIEYGETISYKELATRLGKPKAFRACANANGKNPFSLIIPCHRVIAFDGSLGGYTGGVEIKKILLSIEGVELKKT